MTSISVSLKGGFIALYKAADNGHLQIVAILLDHGADMEARIKVSRYSIE